MERRIRVGTSGWHYAHWRGWLQYCEECLQKGAKDVFVYFDNDQAGYAALNAMALQKMIPKRQKDFRLLTSVA